MDYSSKSVVRKYDWLWKQKGRENKAGGTSRAEEAKTDVGEARSGKWDKE